MSIPLFAAVPPARQLGERPYRIAALIAALLVVFTTVI